jgi:hypothetical protein
VLQPLPKGPFMASASPERAGTPSCGALLLACLAEHGSAGAGAGALASPRAAPRDHADLIHYLCVLHGRYPGLVDHAAAAVTEKPVRTWLADAAYAFAGERAYLARLAVAAGPVPATPGAAGSDAAVLGQRQALETLARSERAGCGAGAAMALVLEWSSVRTALDAAARRFGIEAPNYRAADREVVLALADSFGAAPGVQRALLFGAEQLLLQHRGLWDLIETRREAREAA